MNKKKKDAFNIGELVVYPKHGVGEIKSISTLEISKVKTKYYIIQMEQDKLLIKVPLEKQKVRRIMWSRRAQEYDAKIYSGDIVKIGEVIRDLFRKNNQPEQSYSERQMFQIALERLAREVAAIDKTDYFNTTEKIENILNRK